MEHKNNNSASKQKPTQYYLHSSMELNQKNYSSHQWFETTNQPVGFNRKVSHRGSAENLKSCYNSQSSVRTSPKWSVTTKYNTNSTPYSAVERGSCSKIRPTSKLSTKELEDEEPTKTQDSFDQTILDDSQFSMDVGDDGPCFRSEAISRGIDFTNHRQVLNEDLDKFMDRQLQLVAERIADK